VRERLNEVALERDLRASTRLQYLRNMNQLKILDEPLSAVTKELVVERLWAIPNVNTRRGCAIAVRSILGFQVKVGRSVPRRYNLPSEQDIRLALMTSPHETRGLLMAFAGLRLGEACATVRSDLNGDRLRVTRQVQALRQTGHPTIVQLAPVKGADADIVVPFWLADRIRELTDWVKPDPVRESLRRAGYRVGFHLNPHMLRHWYATTLLDRGAPIALVSRQLRHSDVATTLRHYADHKADVAIHELLG
jgi:integrase